MLKISPIHLILWEGIILLISTWVVLLLIISWVVIITLLLLPIMAIMDLKTITVEEDLIANYLSS